MRTTRLDHTPTSKRTLGVFNGSVCYSLSHAWLFTTPWTVARQAPLPLEFSRQMFWSGLPFLSAGDLPNPGTKPGSLALQADSLPSEPPGKPKKGNTLKLVLTLIFALHHSRLENFLPKGRYFDNAEYELPKWKCKKIQMLWNFGDLEMVRDICKTAPVES